MVILPKLGLDSWFWLFLENHIYHIPDPPRKERTRPLEVICVGPARSGTESLQQALLQLGYDHTLHGYDLIFAEPYPMAGWTRLARRKFYGPSSPSEPATLSRADFDALMPHSAAVTDTVGWLFAAELIEAYPEAKVVLNYRDVDEWHVSMMETIMQAYQHPIISITSWFESKLWWSRHGFYRFMFPNWVRYPYGSMSVDSAMERHGKRAYKEHCDMIRGMVPKEHLLEWKVQDGWEPLCRFLEKDVPAEPFPHANASGAGFQDRVKFVMATRVRTGIRNILILSAIVGGGVVAYVWRRFC